MLKNILIACLVFLIAILTVGYFKLPSNFINSDVNIVKNSPVPTSAFATMFFPDTSAQQSVTIGDSIAKLAGVDGNTEWKSFHPDKYKNNSAVVCVQATVVSYTTKENPQTAVFQFYLNKKTGYVELGYFGLDGTPQNMLETTMALQFSRLTPKEVKKAPLKRTRIPLVAKPGQINKDSANAIFHRVSSGVSIYSDY